MKRSSQIREHDRVTSPGGPAEQTRRILGIDYGERRIGISMSDPTATIATGLTTLSNGPELFGELGQLIADFGVAEIILGLPLTMKGTDSDKTREVRHFKERLEQRYELPVFFEDERLSSRQASASMIEMNASKKQRRNKSGIDRMAAAIILQSYLDRKNKLFP